MSRVSEFKNSTFVHVESESEWVVTLLLQAWNAGVFVGVFEKVVDSKDAAVTTPTTFNFWAILTSPHPWTLILSVALDPITRASTECLYWRYPL